MGEKRRDGLFNDGGVLTTFGFVLFMYVCMCIFRPGGQRPRKVSYWSTGRAELNYLQLLSRWTPPRIPAMSTRINGEPLELLPPRAPSYS